MPGNYDKWTQFTPERIDVIEKMGHLEREDAEFLLQAAVFYRAVDHGLRVLNGHAEGRLPANPAQASILARTHGRAAARAVGVQNPLAELADTEAFCQRVLAFVLAYAGLVQRDWKRFVGHRGDLENVSGWC